MTTLDQVEKRIQHVLKLEKNIVISGKHVVCYISSQQFLTLENQSTMAMHVNFSL